MVVFCCHCCFVIVVVSLLLLLLAVKNKSNNDNQVLTTAEERAIAGSNITEYLEEEVSREKIDLLSCKNMTEALFEFVEKMENDSMST